jgi:sugar phosphate isomerase/epimerase
METSRISVAAVGLSGDLRTALRGVRELGLRGVELDARSGLDAGQMSQTGIRQIRKWLDDEGLLVAAVAFPTRGGYADPDRLEGRIAATKSAMELARDLGAAVVLNHVGDIPPPAAAGGEEKPDPRWNLLVEVLSDLGDWGHRVGARLSAEAGRSAPDDLLRLIEALPEGSLAVHLVTGSLVVHGHDPVAAVARLGPLIAHVHATDAIAGAFKGRGRAVILGSGHVDLPGVLAALEERGYRGWIGLEPVDGIGARAELADAVAALRAL